MTGRCGLAAMMLCATIWGQDRGLDLLHRMQTALGGAERIAAIRDFEQSVEAQTWNRSGQPLGKVSKRVRWVKSSCLRLDQSGPYDTYVLYFDGTSGWEITPEGHFADLAGGELEFARK